MEWLWLAVATALFFLAWFGIGLIPVPTGTAEKPQPNWHLIARLALIVVSIIVLVRHFNFHI